MPYYQLLHSFFRDYLLILCTLQIIVTPKYSKVDGHIRGQQIYIEFIEVSNNKPQQIKLHTVATTQHKLHLWLVIIILL